VDGNPYSFASLDARYAGHEQPVVLGVFMAYRRDYGESDCVVIERPASGRATHSAAASLAGVQRDLLGASLRAAGK
jgi:hypothetical protein